MFTANVTYKHMNQQLQPLLLQRPICLERSSWSFSSLQSPALALYLWRYFTTSGFKRIHNPWLLTSVLQKHLWLTTRCFKWSTQSGCRATSALTRSFRGVCFNLRPVLTSCGAPWTPCVGRTRFSSCSSRPTRCCSTCVCALTWSWPCTALSNRHR